MIQRLMDFWIFMSFPTLQEDRKIFSCTGFERINGKLELINRQEINNGKQQR